MPFENRPGQGALFLNRDRKNDRQPNLRSTALLQLENGELIEIEISAWTKESEKAGRWLSLSVKPKGASNSSRPAQRRPNSQDLSNGVDIDAAVGSQPVDDEDIPF